MTPAMAAGVADKLWGIGDIVKLLEVGGEACYARASKEMGSTYT